MQTKINFKIANQETITSEDIMEVFHENIGNVWIMDSKTLKTIKNLKDCNEYYLVTLGEPPDYGWLLMGRRIVIVKEKCLLFGVL